MDNGFNVERLNIADDVDLTAPTQEVVDQLNAADLVINGRDAYTNTYEGIAQDVLDAITAPVISNNVYGVQWGAPQMWLTNGVNSEVMAEQIWIQVSDDPIFANSNVDADSIYFCNDVLGVMQTPDPHNGEVVGSAMGDQLAIVRFAKDVPYNADAESKTPKSDRTVFSFQTGVKAFNLSEDGQAAYYGEIRRLMGYSITAPLSYYVSPSSVSTLSDLTVSTGTLDPAFSSDVTSYTLEVPVGTTSVDLTATATDPLSELVGGGTISTIPSIATITVTAENGVTMTEYVVDIKEEGTGINDLESTGIRMYPNPASKFITIEGLSSGSEVTVIAITGQLISNSIATGDLMVVDLDNCQSGIYIIKVELEDKAHFSRFIKQ